MMRKNLKLRLRKISRLTMLIFGLSLFTVGSLAQNLNVSGVVTSSEDGLPVPGVNVVVKGTTEGTITDMDGQYNLTVNTGDVLVFSFVGMENKEVTVTGPSLDVEMDPMIFGLDEVVAIGYGTQKKKEVTGAVVQVKSEDLNKIATSDLGSALQGQVAGVNVTASSGAPGASSNIQIRGISSVNGANAPLFVVDGIPQNGDPKLSNSEIESVDILKDAASAAIYGTRGSGGVILITTKKGQEGEMKISVDSYGGIQKITSGIELMDFEEYMYNYLTWQGFQNNNHVDIAWTQLESNPSNFTNNTNLLNTMQNDNASIQNHSVRVSGGKENLTYSVVGNYFDQEGVIINTGYERFNARGNTSFKKGKWTINTTLGFRVEESQNEPWQFLYQAYRYKPFQTSIDPDANTISGAGGSGSNEAIVTSNIIAKFKEENVHNTESFNGNLQLNYEILEGLDFGTRFGGSYGNTTQVLVRPLFKVYDHEGQLVPNSSNTRSMVKNTSQRNTSFAWESNLNFQKRFGEHQLKLLANFSTEKYTFSQFFAEKYDLVSNEVTVLNGATADPNAGSGSGQWGQDRANTLVGMLGRLQYDYKDGRYLLSVSARRDGSSRFGEANRWGTFPSVSVGWNVADEAFWAPLSNVANSLKLRASYGTTGNQNFADYSYAPTIELGYDYAFGPETSDFLQSGGTQTGFANALVQWETTVQRNFGFDLGMFNNQLTFTADFYNTDKEDMLFPLLLPTSTGAGQNANVILNVGDMNNRGMEFALGFRQVGKFSWGTNATFSKNVNEVTKMSSTTEISYFPDGTAVSGVSGNTDRITAIKEGYEAGSYFVMETDGIVNTEEKLAEFQKIVPTAKMGDLIYIDQNGDDIINEKDRVYGGSGAPEFELGWNVNAEYKGFDFSMQWYGSFGNEVINGTKIYSYLYGTHKDLLSQWSPDNPYGVIPSNRGSSHLNYRGWADMWVEDGTFVRLRNVTLGYTFSKKWLERVNIAKLRLYVASDNPLTITQYDGYDPEVGNDGLATRGLDKGSYPISSQYRVGLQLEF